MKVTAVILAGGKSSRMGRDKAALPFGGGTMLTHLVEEYGREFPMAVSVGQAGRYDTGGAPEIVDLQPGMGPLAGLQAAFRALDADAVFLTGTDLPFGSAALARAMVDRMEGTPEADICVIRRADGKHEPLFGVYRRRVLPVVEECLAQGRRAFFALFDRCRVLWVEESELPEFDFDRVMDNLNTPEDYRRAVE